MDFGPYTTCTLQISTTISIFTLILRIFGSGIGGCTFVADNKRFVLMTVIVPLGNITFLMGNLMVSALWIEIIWNPRNRFLKTFIRDAFIVGFLDIVKPGGLECLIRVKWNIIVGIDWFLISVFFRAALDWLTIFTFFTHLGSSEIVLDGYKFVRGNHVALIKAWFFRFTAPMRALIYWFSDHKISMFTILQIKLSLFLHFF